MVSRKRLKNIAHGLYGSFISRNNDVDGYWGIGMLRLHAEEQGLRDVQLDLVSRTLSPVGSLFDRLVVEYAERLNTYLEKDELPPHLVSSALVQLHFEPGIVEGKNVPMTTWGDVFKLTVVLTDDLERIRMATGYGRCGVHDAKRELRSGRFIPSVPRDL